MVAKAVFESGDIVRLKSGSPRMTVDHKCLNASPEAFICCWFDEACKYYSAIFNAATLVHERDAESLSKL